MHLRVILLVVFAAGVVVAAPSSAFPTVRKIFDLPTDGLTVEQQAFNSAYLVEWDKFREMEALPTDSQITSMVAEAHSPGAQAFLMELAVFMKGQPGKTTTKNVEPSLWCFCGTWTCPEDCDFFHGPLATTL
jgi:hypothetical protein